MVTASLVAERQLHRQLRYSVGFVQIHGLDGLRIWPTFGQPRLDGAGRRLDLQPGSTKRALGSVVGREGDVVVPPNAQVDRALGHLTLKWSEPFAHMLRLGFYVRCFRPRWRLHTAGARWADRPGSLPPSGWVASRPGRALRPGRCRGTAASPGRRPQVRRTAASRPQAGC